MRLRAQLNHSKRRLLSCTTAWNRSRLGGRTNTTYSVLAACDAFLEERRRPVVGEAAFKTYCKLGAQTRITVLIRCWHPTKTSPIWCQRTNREPRLERRPCMAHD